MDIIDEINRRLPLLSSMVGFPSGNGSHPVHGSTSGSNLAITDSSGLWNCFRCHAGGHALHMPAILSGRLTCEEVKDRKNFPIVLEEAAKFVGLEKEFKMSKPEHREVSYDEYKRLKEALSAAQRYYRDNLTNHIRDKIHEFWGFDYEQIKKLGLGYAPPEKYGLVQYLKDKGFTLKEIAKTGLVTYKNKNKPYKAYDFFQGRITLPWLNEDKEVMYYTARETPFTNTWQGKTKNKYVKQMLWKKDRDYVSKLIYQPIFGNTTVNDNIDYLVIAEGITDAMSLMLWDIPVISPVTVQFNEKQTQPLINIINKYPVPVFICFDAEENNEGLKGALKTMDMIPAEIETFMIQLDRGKNKKTDLNDFFKHKTKEQFLELKAKALDRKEAAKLWRYFKEPVCITEMMGYANKAATPKTKQLYLKNFIVPCFMYTMGYDTETIRHKIKIYTPTITDPTIDAIIANTIDLPTEEKEHSCKRLLENTKIKTKYCKPANCPHRTDDFPKHISIVDTEALFDNLMGIDFIQLPKHYTEREYTYELTFPKSLFGKTATFVITGPELMNPIAFSRRFLDTFQTPFLLPGKTKNDKAEAWNGLKHFWFENMKKPLSDEVAGTIQDLEETFVSYIDECNNRFFSFELDDYINTSIDQCIYYIQSEQQVYVPTVLVKVFLEDKKYDHKLTQFRGFLKHLLTANSLKRKIKNKTVRMWPIKFTADLFPNIAVMHAKSLEMEEKEKEVVE